MQSVEVQSNLAQFRAKRAISAIQLAAEAGVSRQTIHSIESGLYVPNTAVSLILARILDTTVEELFLLEAPPKAIEETAEVHILGGTTSLPKGQPLRLATVNENLVAVAPDPASWGLQPSDAVYLEPYRGSKGSANAKVRLLSESGRTQGAFFLLAAIQVHLCLRIRWSGRALNLSSRMRIVRVRLICCMRGWFMSLAPI